MNPHPLTDIDSLVRGLRLEPSLETRFRAFYDSVQHTNAVPGQILDLCRVRIAFIHGMSDHLLVAAAESGLDDASRAALRSGAFQTFDRDAQIALALAEKIPFAHHDVTDQEVADARAAFGERGAVALLTALAFVDVFCRLHIVLPSASPVSTFPPVSSTEA